MVPARNLLRRHYDSYGGCFDDTHMELQQHKASLRLNPMAEEDSRSDEEDEVEGGEEQEVGARWLQLGTGTGSSSTRPVLRPTRVELDLFSHRPSDPQTTARPPLPVAAAAISGIPAAAMMVPFWNPNVSWGLWNPNPTASTSTPRPVPQYLSGTPVVMGGLGSGGMRLVSPPSRPQTGVWFVLQAAQNQAKEPFLPQIPKSYLRIKDGRMTVRLLMKYLVNKLGLDNESEVEITCRGQLLSPCFTLLQVRDNIWCSMESMMTLLPESLTADHVMTLQYGRSI